MAKVKNQDIHIRAKGELKEHLLAIAEKQGVRLSELVHKVLEEFAKHSR